MPRAGAIAAILTILAFFLIFAGDGLFAYFTPDDMMNLYFAWFRPLTDTDRYLGTLVYRALFALFGWNPLPYRAVCMFLLLANLGLLYRFCLRLSGSREIAALACLLGAYHAHLADLYYSTGTIYDLLCGLMYLGAFLVITRPETLRWFHVACFLGLYAAALNAKEMAVLLPAIVLVYDLLYLPKPRWRIIGAAVLMTAAHLAVKFGTSKMLDNPDYRPTFTWSAFMDTWQHYTFDLFYGGIAFTPLRVVLLWAVLAALVLAIRRRAAVFAILYLFIAMLPVAFIPPRGFFAVYLTLPGWYLLAAITLVSARNALVAPRPALQAGLFAAVAIAVFPLHRHQKPIAKQWVPAAHAAVRSIVEHLPDTAGALPSGAKVLFVSDPYAKDEWMFTFIFRLYYRDDTLRVDRVRAMRTPPDAAGQAEYDRLFVTDGQVGSPGTELEFAL